MTTQPKYLPGAICVSDIPCVRSFPDEENVWLNGDGCKPSIGSQLFLILGDVISLDLQHPKAYVMHKVVYVALWNEQKVYVPEKWLQPISATPWMIYTVGDR